jgi:hypothetical protein
MTSMFKKCQELDLKIERYRRIRNVSLDDAVVTGTTLLIAQAEAEKAAPPTARGYRSATQDNARSAVGHDRHLNQMQNR